MLLAGLNRMKLRKVISGGQTGADFTALECAQALGMQTGGTCPKGCRTDEGPNPALVSDYGLVESDSWAYPPRTRDNVRESEATVWFGRRSSPGYRCTASACILFHKRLYANPNSDTLRLIVNTYAIVNIAGNRKSTNPDVVALVVNAFGVIAEELCGDC